MRRSFIALVISLAPFATRASIGWCESMSPFVDEAAIPIYTISANVIGAGGTSKVYAASVKWTDGSRKKMAFKSVHPSLANSLESKEKLLQPIFKSSASNYFNKIHSSNYKCFAKTDSGNLMLNHVVMVDLASGAADKLIPHLKLSADEAMKDPKNFERKLAILEKFSEQNKMILSTLKENGLVHSDIRPENIFFTTNNDIKDLSKITAKDLNFQLGDYDTLVKQNSHLVGKTSVYLSPETFRTNISKHEQDIYAASSSLFDMMTGNPPVDYAKQFDKKIPHEVRSLDDHQKVGKYVGEYFDQFSDLKNTNPDLYRRFVETNEAFPYHSESAS